VNSFIPHPRQRDSHAAARRVKGNPLVRRPFGRSLASVIVQAALFGAVHVLQVAAGSPLAAAPMVVLNCFVSGIWWGAMALRWGSLWPVVLLHGLSNAAVLVKGLSSPYIEPAARGYARATLLEIPLLALGVWLLLRASTAPRARR
jgi:membrane protease YdiL (CAAX protease family)